MMKNGINAGKKNSKKVRCIETGQIFESTVNARKYVGTSINAISECCRGKRKSAGELSDGTKLHWEYIN